MNTKERFPTSSHEVTNSREQGESFDYKKYGIEPTVKSNSLDGDNFIVRRTNGRQLAGPRKSTMLAMQ